MHDTLKQLRAEGFILHDRNATFRPARSGSIKAVKWCGEASVIVGPKEAKKLNDGHRSIGMYVRAAPHSSKLVYLGSVGIPGKYKLPECGSIIDVKYLYAYPGSNHLIQAKFLGKFRDDVLAKECTLGQLKMKADA